MTRKEAEEILTELTRDEIAALKMLSKASLADESADKMADVLWNLEKKGLASETSDRCSYLYFSLTDRGKIITALSLLE